MVPQIYNGIIFSYVYNGIKGLTTVKKNNGLEYCQAYSVQKVLPILKVTVSTGVPVTLTLPPVLSISVILRLLVLL